MQIENLELELSPDGLRMVGELHTDTAQAEIRRQFEQIDLAIRQKGKAAFQVDVRGLTSVNSSAIRIFVDWISRADSGKYKLVFLIDRGITWHRLSFAVLQSLAPASVELVDAARAQQQPEKPGET